MNTPDTQTPAAFDAKEMKKITQFIYFVLIAGMAAQFMLITIAPGSVAVLCAIVYAYIKRKELKDTWLESHYRWMTRSFWIGGAVYLPIATIALSIFQGLFVDLQPMYAAMYEGEKDVMVLMKLVYDSNDRMMFLSTIAVLAVFALWWCLRCGIGLYHLRKEEAVPDVTRWL